MLIAVTGLPGVGKTTWIRQQMAQADRPGLYFSPGCGNVAIDSAYLAATFPEWTIESEGNSDRLLEKMRDFPMGYLELGFHLDLVALEPVLQKLGCRRVAVMPPNLESTGWHAWADEIVPGMAVNLSDVKLQISRSLLTGEVLDYASLDVFWYELTQGAYGEVVRAKGIFDLTEGRSFYFDFVAGMQQPIFEELNLPQWLQGRPDRFSGIEIFGYNLEQKLISETLHDCCLSDRAISYYQQQIQAELETLEEVPS
jgi:hypothetical protein